MNEELKVENAENVPVENTTITVESKDLNPKESKMGLELSTVSDQAVAYDAALLEGKNLEELLEEASTVLVLTPKGARKKLGVVRSVFFERFAEAKDAALEIYKQDESEEKELFAFDKESIALKFKEIEDAVKQSVAEEKERIETEKLKNFNRKKELLKNLEEIVANDETLESIKQVKDIQKEWKNIRVLPKDGISELWDTYNLLQNKFYDNHSINIELKELDRQKNLEAKIDLTKKMDELHGEKSLKRSFILLNKYHEEFKNTGPVPAESREPIWEAFKKASDSVYDAKRKLYEELESEKDSHLKKKEILAEKASLLNEVLPKSNKEWNERTKAFDELFEEWKKIGPVPKSNKDAVWIAFNGVRNDFYNARKIYFKEIHGERSENLKKKEALCEKVEALKEDTSWGDTTKKIITLQGEWKTIGPVPDKNNQVIWKRFRGACDSFFEAKNNAFAGKREEEEANLAKKKELIKALEELASKDIEHKEALSSLKKISGEWRAVGYVPHKSIKTTSEAYEKANSEVYQKYSGQIEKAKLANLDAHYKELKKSPDGKKALENEERGVQRKIDTLNEEIASIERNMSFFAMSKTAEKMLKEFEGKIEKAKKYISKLKKEMVAIRNAKKEQAETPKESESPEAAPSE